MTAHSLDVLLDPSLATSLSDARRQTHHAVQLATAAGISYLRHEADDSHTNLEWLAPLGALASRVVPERVPFRLAVRFADLSLLVLDGGTAIRSSFALHGHSVDNAATWIRARVSELGVDGRAYTLQRHYDIPPHPVANGAAFDTGDRAAFEQLRRWYACASEHLEAIRRTTPGASEVRCWPHHFDIATLIDLGAGRTTGVGLEPGDVYYDEPYFYVNVSPQPSASAITATLDGKGAWHTTEWIGAVLRGSRLTAGPGQRAQIEAFLRSAVTASRALAGAPTAKYE